jgi:hypothetical protein
MAAKTERGLLSRIGWRIGQQVLPLPVALYANLRYLRGTAPTEAALPAGEWVPEEGGGLLDRSEDRLQSLEGKGPGLATVCAIVAAAIAVAISLDWTGTTTVAKAILVAAGACSFMSLWAPIVLVGPVARATVTSATLREAEKQTEPTVFLANQKAQAAADNDRSTQRLSNLQAASRNDVRNAIILFGVWAILTLAGVAKA